MRPAAPQSRARRDIRSRTPAGAERSRGANRTPYDEVGERSQSLTGPGSREVHCSFDRGSGVHLAPPPCG